MEHTLIACVVVRDATRGEEYLLPAAVDYYFRYVVASARPPAPRGSPCARVCVDSRRSAVALLPCRRHLNGWMYGRRSASRTARTTSPPRGITNSRHVASPATHAPRTTSNWPRRLGRGGAEGAVCSIARKASPGSSAIGDPGEGAVAVEMPLVEVLSRLEAHLAASYVAPSVLARVRSGSSCRLRVRKMVYEGTSLRVQQLWECDVDLGKKHAE